MIQTVTMPKWGLSMKIGKVTEWLVDEGDTVAPGDDLADIETEKISGTLESAQDGVLRRIVARPGEEIPVSGVIAVVAPADVPDADIDAVVDRARAEIAELAAANAQDDGGPAVRTVEVAGHQISYATAGEGGDVVVMVHGFGGDRNSWLFLQEPLAEGGRTVHALDLPGHGSSSKDVRDDVDLDALAAVVVGFLDAVGADRAHLVGHSLGGAVAAAAAARAPDRVRTLTLVAPAGFGSEADAEYLRGFVSAQSRRELKPLLGRLFGDESLVTRQLVDDVLKYKRLDGVDGSLRRLLDRVLLAADGSQALDTRSVLASLETPRVVVWGTADRILPASQAPPGDERTEVRIVDGAGHMAHMESPTVVLEAMEKLLG